jgi:hypothetical protein
VLLSLPLIAALCPVLSPCPPIVLASPAAERGFRLEASGVAPDYWAHRLSKDYAGHAIGLTLLLAAADEDAGERFFCRAGDAAAWTGIATQILKLVVRAPRPGGYGHDSFPSGHSSAAFSLAAAVSRQYPALTPISYAWAGAVAYSRIVLNRHRWSEVIAGGLLGVFVSDWAMHRGPAIAKHLLRTWHTGSAEFRIGPRLDSGGVSLLHAEW